MSQHSEVRRAALYNMTLLPSTLPHILSRTRDIDPTLRRTVFFGSLSSASLDDPRRLTLEQRHEIVKNGLGDRELGVRRATAGMLGGWLEGDGVKGDLNEVRASSHFYNLSIKSNHTEPQFLRRFDLVNGPVAEDALLSLFVSKPALLDSLVFDGDYVVFSLVLEVASERVLSFTDAFWKELTPESALIARVFVDHCRSTNVSPAMRIVCAIRRLPLTSYCLD